MTDLGSLHKQPLQLSDQLSGLAALSTQGLLNVDSAIILGSGSGRIAAMVGMDSLSISFLNRPATPSQPARR